MKAFNITQYILIAKLTLVIFLTGMAAFAQTGPNYPDNQPVISLDKTRTYKNGTLIQPTANKVANALQYSSVMPEFHIIDSCDVSKTTGYHDGNGWVDIDNDSDLDLIITYSTSNNKPNLMFRNERGELFVRINNTEYSMQSVNYGLPGPFGDIDNDGDEDLILAEWQGTQIRIYLNDGYGNFSAVTTITKSSGATTALMDVNEDSFLDLVVLNINGGKIYHNDGHGNYSDYDNIDIDSPNPTSQLLIMAFGDADSDNDFDLYLGNMWRTSEIPDEKNMFYLNNGSGNFDKEPDTSAIVSTIAPTMGVNWVDYDNDGDMDLYVLESSIYGPPTDYTGVLYENKGGLTFEEHIIEPVEYCNTHKISPVWGDLNNDGDLDLLITVEKNNFYNHTTDLKHNILFQNNGDRSFTEIMEGTLVEESSHSATMEDYDNDGDLDVLLVGFAWKTNGTNYLCENEGNGNSWMILTCKGTYSSKSAYGARIQAIATINDKRVIQTREISPTTGHNTTYPSTRVHFGLADAEKIDSLIIKWPLGHEDIYTNVNPNQFYRAIEDSVLEIDFAATNYIRYKPYLADTVVYEGESLSFNLEDYYKFVKGDTVPEINGDTLSFSLYANENPDAVNASIEGNVLTLTPGTTKEVSNIQVRVSAGFIERVDGFNVEYREASGIFKVLKSPFSIYPNPVNDVLIIESLTKTPGSTNIKITDITGKVVLQRLNDSSTNVIKIDCSKLKAGMYFVNLESDKELSSYRLIIVDK